jgi:putative ABC transport system permease protein
LPVPWDLLTTLAFASLAAGKRISRISGAALFRSHLVRVWRKEPSWQAISSLRLAHVGGWPRLLVLVSFDNMRVTALYLAGLVGAFVILALLAWALLRAVAALPRPGNIYLRHALLAMHRPGASAISVILALGLGLTLFVALALTDRIISRELRAGIPEKAPAFFVLDVRNEELPAFRDHALAVTGVTAVNNAPMLRGRVVAVKGVPVDQVEVSPDAAWAIRGDRGLTYAETLPEGSTLVEGEWWPKDYDGPPLVSMVDEIAEGLALRIGDRIRVNVLGREIEAEVRQFPQGQLAQHGHQLRNGVLAQHAEAAPHSHVVTIEMDGGDEAAFLNDIAQAYPSDHSRPRQGCAGDGE